MNNTKIKSKMLAIVSLVVLIVLMGFFAAVGSGVLQYGVAAVGCMRAPVAASRFMASYSYEVPGDQGYGPSVFNEYFCTEDEAKKAGFHRNPLTDEATEETKAQMQKWEEEKRFSPEKIDFTAYVPQGGAYTTGKLEVNSMGPNSIGEPTDNKQVFFTIKKDGYRVANAREGKVPNGYELCRGAQDSCETIGTDAAGRLVKKQIANRDIVSYGITINNTFVNLEGVVPELTTQDVLAIFSSLGEYRHE